MSSGLLEGHYQHLPQSTFGQIYVFDAVLGIQQVLSTSWLRDMLRIIIVIGTKRTEHYVEGQVHLVL